MIVCVCHNISDKSIREQVRAGACTVESLAAELGVGTQCGCCRDCVREVVDDELRLLASTPWANPYPLVQLSRAAANAPVCQAA
jgi:bacterioferritin-associated ferredoxin